MDENGPNITKKKEIFMNKTILVTERKNKERFSRKRSMAAFGVFLMVSTAFLVTLSITGSHASAEQQKEFDIVIVDPEPRNGRRDGFEPHVIAGPAPGGDGEWYYYDSPSGLLSPGLSNTRRPGNVWISKDYGRSWEFKEKDNAIIDLLPQDPGGSGDTFIALSKNGAIFHTDLYLASASVDMSLDGGENWYLNPMASDYVIDDRQWLDIGPTRDGFPGVEETLYFCFNQMTGGGLVMTKIPILTDGPLDNYLWTPCNGGVPITTDVSARDVFCVDEVSGTIYISNYAPGRNQVEVWKSTNGGTSFSRHPVLDADTRAEVQNIFTVIDTDMEGNVYITYSSREHIWLAVSTDEAESWTIHQVTETTSVKALPWIAAGDGGMVGMAWYESDPGLSGSPDTQTESWWDVNVALSYNADEEEPSFEVFTMDPDVHYGGVQTTGTGGGSDRDLGDLLACDIDSHGRFLVSYGEDGDDGNNNRMSYPMYAGQTDGPFLRENKGIVIDYELKLDGSTATLTINDVSDLEGLDIENVTVDWGDGSPSGILGDESVVSHGYPSSDENYELRISATNVVGMRTTAVAQLDVEAGEDWEIAGISGWVVVTGVPLFLIMIVLAAFVMRRDKDEGPKILEAEKVPAETAVTKISGEDAVKEALTEETKAEDTEKG